MSMRGNGLVLGQLPHGKTDDNDVSGECHG